MANERYRAPHFECAYCERDNLAAAGCTRSQHGLEPQRAPTGRIVKSARANAVLMLLLMGASAVKLAYS